MRSAGGYGETGGPPLAGRGENRERGDGRTIVHHENWCDPQCEDVARAHTGIITNVRARNVVWCVDVEKEWRATCRNGPAGMACNW